jgi:hypothetical protein
VIPSSPPARRTIYMSKPIPLLDSVTGRRRSMTRKVLLNAWVWMPCSKVDCLWNVMAHAQKPDFIFRRNGRVHLSRRGRQFSRLLAAEVCAPAVVMLDISCSEVVWRLLVTHSICQFPLHFPSRASPCAITFQLDSECILRTPMLYQFNNITF